MRALTIGLLVATAAVAQAQTDSAARGNDPRVGLKAGWTDAGVASRGLRLVSHTPRPEGFVNPREMGDFGFANSDLAFAGRFAYQGNFNGWQVWDIGDPAAPKLRKSFTCPGGQGDLSIHGNLLFMSVEETRGRGDCGAQAMPDSVSPERFRGVRIFDISDIDAPKQVAAVQTCRGSHTHTLVPDPRDRTHVYVYVAGTAPVRPGSELAGCSGAMPDRDPKSSYFSIDVIHVLLSDPSKARIVSSPRIFADSAGNPAGLWRGGTHGQGTQETATTDQCHDITVYPELGLAAGACSGNGILLDIRDPARPRRVAEVSDPNFAYWHSATFSNDGAKVIYTDEWGGGVAPRCKASDRPTWGADAIFTRDGHALTHRGYYKLPAPQTAQENCVAHNGSLVPVPGRDIMVQAWYQGGTSVFDFTDPANPVEIAYFDRGPMSDELVLGGHWSSYWYNGHVYASEIGRGLDVFELTPSEHLSQNEIDAAKLVRMERFNPQLQTRLAWPAHFSVARAYVDQLARGSHLSIDRIASLRSAIDAAERQQPAARRTALTRLATTLEREAPRSTDAAKVQLLARTLRGLR